MTARFSWNEQDTRGHRPRLQKTAGPKFEHNIIPQPLVPGATSAPRLRSAAPRASSCIRKPVSVSIHSVDVFRVIRIRFDFPADARDQVVDASRQWDILISPNVSQ